MTLDRLAHGTYLLSVALLLYRGPTLGPIKVADLVLAAALVFFVLENYDNIILDRNVLTLFTAFVCLSFVSVAISQFGFSLGILVDFARYLFGFGLAVMTFQYVWERSRGLETLVHTLTLAAIPSVALAIVAVGVLLFGYHSPWTTAFLHKPYELRAAPFFYDPNHYASVLTIPYVISFNYVFSYLRGNHGRPSLWLGTPLLLAAGIVATGSRTGLGILAVTTTLLVGVPLIRALIQTRIDVTSAFLLLLIGGASTVVVTGDTLFALLEAGVQRDNSVQRALADRVQLWSVALRVWSNNPLFGVGLGNYIQYLSTVAESWGLNKFKNPHNTYFGVLAQGGVFGFGVVFLMFVVPTLTGVRTLWNTTREYALLGVVLLVAMGSWGVFLDIFTSRRLWFALGLSLGIFYSATRPPEVNPNREEPV